MSNKIFKLEDLESKEIINIIVAMSAIKVNDRDFLAKLVKPLEKKVMDLNKIELFNLAKSFITYVR